VRFVGLKTISKNHEFSLSQLRKFIKFGLPHYKVKGKILVDSEEFENWFSNNFKVEHIKSSKDIESIVSKIVAEYRGDSP
jgi:hypothetical protein